MKAGPPRVIEVEHPVGLDDYAALAHLAPAVASLRAAAAQVVPRLRGRTVWMVNSTATGGGVAELLPTMVRLFRDLGVVTEWAVMETDQAEFFQLTKRIHNLMHGAGEGALSDGDKGLYEAVNRANARGMARLVAPGDVLVVHDPQPMAMAGMLAEQTELVPVWRCHIGLDEENAATRAAWSFLQPYADPYRHAVFSAPEYVPPFLRARSSVIYPGIDPLASKNREMHLHEVVRVLGNAALASVPGPVLTPPFEHLAKRLQPDGSFRPAIWPEDIGLLVRPIVTQVSRWDRLKGFAPLLRAFDQLKREVLEDGEAYASSVRRRLEVARLVLAGPEAEGVSDDPEATEVLEELTRAYLELEPVVQPDVALIQLPMTAPAENALMVNALQRASSLVAQNSLREGFGLTVTEAMWKRIPVLSNTRACGPRQQVRDGREGRMIADPEDTRELAAALADALSDPDRADVWGHAAQRRVHDRFLMLGQLEAWLGVLGKVV